jgi:hypothetical protein
MLIYFYLTFILQCYYQYAAIIPRTLVTVYLDRCGLYVRMKEKQDMKKRQQKYGRRLAFTKC